MNKHYKVTHDGCETKFVIQNAKGKDIKDCKTEACLKNFDNCLTVQEVEEKPFNPSIQNMDSEDSVQENNVNHEETDSFHLFSSVAQKKSEQEHESVEENSQDNEEVVS